MLGKAWKKILLVIVIVACLFNVVKKIVQRNSLREELQATLNFKLNQIEQEKKENTTEVNNTNNGQIVINNQSDVVEQNNQQTVSEQVTYAQ